MVKGSGLRDKIGSSSSPAIYQLCDLGVSSTVACATACDIFCTKGMSALGVADSKVEGSSAPRALLE